MSDSPFFQFYPSDWLAGTRGLTASETGIYITLVAMMYETEAPVPSDTKRLSRLCGCTPSAFKKAVEGLLSTGKLTQDERGFFNRRVEIEIEKRSEKRAAAKQSANRRWEKSKENQSGANANASIPQCERNANQKPEPDIKEEPKGSSKKRGSRLTADWVLPRAWGEWANGRWPRACPKSAPGARLTSSAITGRHELAQGRRNWIGWRRGVSGFARRLTTGRTLRPGAVKAQLPPSRARSAKSRASRRSTTTTLGGLPTMREFDVCAFEERAAIAEFDGGMTRFEAETLAAQMQGVARWQALQFVKEATNANGREFTGASGDPARALDRQRNADRVSRVQRQPEEKNGSMSERVAQAGRAGLVLLALWLQGGASV